MKADVTLNNHTWVAVEGKKMSEILDKVCRENGLSELGRAQLTYKIYEEKEDKK